MRIVALQLTCAPLPVAFHRIPAGNVGVGCYSELAPAHTCKLAEREREREREREGEVGVGEGGERKSNPNLSLSAIDNNRLNSMIHLCTFPISLSLFHWELF